MRYNLDKIIADHNFPGGAVVRHGFTDYMRDYEIIVVGKDGPPFKDVHKYQFILCVEANIKCSVVKNVLANSSSDALVYAGPDYSDSPEPDGFIWGLRYSTSQTGINLIEDSVIAENWSREVGIKFYEAKINTEAFAMQFIFSDVRCQPWEFETQYARKQYPIE